MKRKLSVPVSSVYRPAPMTNMLPQKPPKDAFTLLSQKRRRPTVSTARPRRFSRHENLQRGDEILTDHEGNSEAIASQNQSIPRWSRDTESMLQSKLRRDQTPYSR